MVSEKVLGIVLIGGSLLAMQLGGAEQQKVMGGGSGQTLAILAPATPIEMGESKKDAVASPISSTLNIYEAPLPSASSALAPAPADTKKGTTILQTKKGALEIGEHYVGLPDLGVGMTINGETKKEEAPISVVSPAPQVSTLQKITGTISSFIKNPAMIGTYLRGGY